jgi:propionate CoA-transferase
LAHLKTVSAAEAAAMVPDGATVAISGSGGGILEPSDVFEAVRHRFDAQGAPAGLTVVHAFGIGHPSGRGLELWADPRLVRRVVGGHWSWSPTMQRLARDGEIEAYALGSGAISLLLREIGAGRPGLLTRTGLGTFVDPRHGGGRWNARATEDIVELVTLAGQEYLRYLPFTVDVGLIRGSSADEDGNITCRDEPAALDVLAVAMAAKACGGRVIAQVREVVPNGRLDPWTVAVPGHLVDSVVVAPTQWQTYGEWHDPTLAGVTPEEEWPARAGARAAEAALRMEAMPLARRLVAGRAAREARPGQRTNVGFGISADVVTALAARHQLDDIELLIEQGAVGGEPVGGELFGASRGFRAMVTSTTQFDVFSGGLLDQAFLGMAQVDAAGSVNVSLVGGRLVGPGGFIDISQNAREVVFCGTFTTRGLEVSTDGSRLRIDREGTVRKFVTEVDHVTYSGALAATEHRDAVYVTERATFVRRGSQLELTELVAGIDLERDVLAQMDVPPIVRDPVVVEVGEYMDGAMRPHRAATQAASVAMEVP